ncbi:MAG: YggS family pyridoxal phosphate-dependent enzyme [Acidobacteriota bacterium]
MSLKENIEFIGERIKISAKKSGRNPEEIKILGATKSVPTEKIIEAYEAGIKLFGENRVQEANQKISEINIPSIEWHMIGNLQKNKVKKALELFSVIESLSSIELAEKINRDAELLNRKIRCFIEVNLAGEETKWGIKEEDIFSSVGKLTGLKNIEIIGLMAIPPFFENPEMSRPYFKELREIKEKINRMNLDNISIMELSMGMSSDYEVAVEEGATIVRLGTILFGPRNRGKK